MNVDQTYVSLPADALLAKVRELRDQGWRLVQIGATPAGESIELNYSFDRAGSFLNLRLTLPAAAAHVPSISPLYWCAFIYENEMHDLFRVHVEGIAVDYKGTFYKTTVPFPFSSRGPAAAGPAANPVPATVAPAPKA
jgi:ech hydrogenase subunit D